MRTRDGLFCVVKLLLTILPHALEQPLSCHWKPVHRKWTNSTAMSAGKENGNETQLFPA